MSGPRVNIKVHFSLDQNMLTWFFYMCCSSLCWKIVLLKKSLEYCDRSQEFGWLVFVWLGWFLFFYKVLNTVTALWQPFACYIGTVRFQRMAWCLVTWAPQWTEHKVLRKGELSKASLKHMMFYIFLMGKLLPRFALGYITVDFPKKGLKDEGAHVHVCFCSLYAWWIIQRNSLVLLVVVIFLFWFGVLDFFL